MRMLMLAMLLPLTSMSLALAESDEEITSRVYASAKKIFLDQATWALPESFWNSGLAESDKTRIVQTLAEDSATCFVNAILEYSAQSDRPLSELVSDDNTVGFNRDAASMFLPLYEPCLQTVWQAAGVSLP